MNITSVAGFAMIVPDPPAAQAFYRDALGVPLRTVMGDYVAVDGWGGVRHLGVWPLADAAQACWGTRTWPADVPVPQATMEFELATPEEVEPAIEELRAAGYRVIHGAHTEPWGQVIARVLGPEGLLIGLCHSPWIYPAAETPSDA